MEPETEEQATEEVQAETPQPASDDLDALLAEFEDTPETPATPQTPQQEDVVVSLQSRLDAMERERSAEKINGHFSKLMGDLKADEELSDVPDKVLQALADSLAKEDPRLVGLFAKSMSDTKAYDALKSRVLSQVKEEVGAIKTRNIASDVRAATTAARVSSSEPRAEEVNTIGMSNAEFMKHRATLPKR